MVGIPVDHLAAETETLRFFLDRLDAALDESSIFLAGRVFLASSAGGVYGGSAEHPSTKATPPRPISDYGLAKLSQKNMVLEWAPAPDSMRSTVRNSDVKSTDALRVLKGEVR